MKAIRGDHPGSFDDAQALEQKGELKAAAALYEKLLKQSSSRLRIIRRLLVLFRKLKNADKELHYIDTAIKIHERKYTPVQTFNKKAITLSKQLNKLLGHTDNKGKAIFVADEIHKLELRKTRLLKKHSAGKK
jgi:tetratricopeptide (TPR) repeat protein